MLVLWTVKIVRTPERPGANLFELSIAQPDVRPMAISRVDRRRRVSVDWDRVQGEGPFESFRVILDTGFVLRLR